MAKWEQAPTFTSDGSGSTWQSAPLVTQSIDSMIDQKKGAPMRVRGAVGAAVTDDDRLATIRKFFPDAQPYGEGNFVFSDPKTKRPTLYNPKGFDAGDIISAGPEISEFLGGTAGGLAAAASAPITAGSSIVTIPAATGLGAAGGREIYGNLAKYMYGTEDTRSLGQRLSDLGVTAGVNAAGARIGDLVGQGIKAVSGPVMRWGKSALIPGGKAAAEDFANAGVTPSAGAITGNPMIQTTEKWLAGTPGGANPMRDLGERQVAEISDEAGRLAKEYGGGQSPKTVEEIGGTIKAAAKGAADRFNATQEKAYDKAFSLIGKDAPVKIRGGQLDNLLSEFEAEMGKAPESLKPYYAKAMQRVDSIVKDANANGEVSFDAVRRIRTLIGKEINDPVLAGVSSAEQPALQRLYAALTGDIKETAKAAGPKAAKALDVADRYTRFNMNQTIPTLQKIVDTGTDAEAFNLAMRGSKDGGEMLSKLKSNFKPEEWDQISGTVLGRLGRATPGKQGATSIDDAGGEFSINTFLTNWNKLSPEARKELFGGTRYQSLAPQLDRLNRVVARLKETDAVANPSGTGRMVSYGATAAGAGAAANDVMSGDVSGGAKIAALTVVAPRVAARLITNPNFVRWLADSATPAAGDLSKTATLARLAATAKMTPEIRDELNQYFDAIRQ